MSATEDATDTANATVRDQVRMLRSIGLAFCLVAIMLAACGRQITFPPSGTTSTIPAGYMLVRFNIASQGQFDFTNYTYAIVFNTSGVGGTPYANTQFQGGFLNYSYGWFVGGAFGTVQSPPVLVQYYVTPGNVSQAATQQIVVPLNLATLTLNSNGQNTQFTLLFKRTLLDRPPIATGGPSPTPTGATPAPTPSGATPTPAPSGATPTPSPSGATPTPSPGGNSCSTIYTYICDIWYVNFFVLDRNGVPLDALGINGVNDTTFSLALPTNTTFDYVQQLSVPAGAIPPGNANEQISGGEISNNP